MATIKDLQAQKDANSDAWHTATTQAEKDRLHQENVRLQQQIDSMSGTTSSFNPGTGKWTTTGGSAATSGVNTWTDDQQAIKDQMTANSDAWHTATSQEEKDRLHQENQQLAGQLGGNISFNPSTGTWTGAAQQQPTTVTDYSNYLEEMFEAQRRQALAQLNSAYQSNLNAIDQSAVGVDAQYQNARNQAAGASELSARNFAEYAAASGLNSGAAGQAELARNVALQNDLTSLAQNEADFYSNIELQKQQAEIDYNNAIAQAEASNDYAAAQALYQEKIRVQNALIEQQWKQMQFDLQKQSLALQEAQQNTANQQWQQQFEYGKESDEISRLISTGQAALESGLMPSSDALAAMGITAQQAQSYIDFYNMLRSVQTQQAQAELSAYQASAGAGSNSSGVGNASTVRDSAPQYNNGSLSAQQIKQMQQAIGVDADGYWGPASQAAAGGLSADQAWTSLFGDSQYTPSAAVQAQIRSLESMRAQTGSDAGIVNSIITLGATGKITMKDAEYMLRYFGYNPSDYIDYT